MADQKSDASQLDSSYLSPNQQDLLLAALNSQADGRQNTYPPTGATQIASMDLKSQPLDMNDANDAGLYMSPQQATFDSFDDYSPDLDYLDGDNFDFDNADLGGEMIGALREMHEKRKNSEDSDDAEEGDAKRQEVQDGEKSAKKPGRKPLTSEPTTKRKAQNRAAQRAFRERKEKHLKDLETKVSELTKAKEADKHENGLLKAQVERLQVELREYRKRLSLNGYSGANRSPPLMASGPGRSNSNPSAYNNNFQFDFPKFGALPGSQIFGSQNFSNGSNPALAQRASVTPPITHSPTNGSFSGPSQPMQNGSRQNSVARSMSRGSVGSANTGSPSQMANANAMFAPYSTNDNMHGFAGTLPAMSGTSTDPFGDLFSPSILKGASVDNTNNYFPGATQANATANLNSVLDPNSGDSTAGLNRVFQFNSNSSGSDTASPSASSASQWNGNANSSTGTSPEPSHGSPANKANDKFINGQRHQSPLATSNQTADSNNTLFTPDYNLPSLETFDPVLFGDYRDSQDAIIGGGDFTGGFFDEALQPFDYSSPSNLFGILSSPPPQTQQLKINRDGPVNAPTPSKNLMAEIEKTREGLDDDYGLPSAPRPARPLQLEEGKYISCNNIWNQLQSNPDFQEGKFDLDSLCSELKAKARCSESGVLVDQEHVDAALKKLGKKDDKGKAQEAPPWLMFEQESWDNVLKKLGNNKA